MAKTSGKVSTSAGKRGEILIPKDIEKMLESLPEKRKTNPFTEQEDMILMKYSGKKQITSIARILNRPVSSCRDRYEMLRRRGGLNGRNG